MSYNQIIAKWRFSVTIGGVEIPFQEVSGLSGTEIEKITYETGDKIEGAAPKVFLGKVKPPETITLKKGAFKGETILADWFESKEEQTILVTLLDEQQKGIITWTTRGFVTKIDGWDLSAANSEMVIQEVTCALTQEVKMTTL